MTLEALAADLRTLQAEIAQLRARVDAIDPGPLSVATAPDPVKVAARSLLAAVLTHRATITTISAALGALAHWLVTRGAP